MIVRILCEDYRHDQYIARPIVEAILEEAGYQTARVEIVRDPILGSVDAALDWSRVAPILDRYRGMTDLFVLLVDRDGNKHRIDSLQSLEQKARSEQHRPLFGENAWQEIEVWALAGQPTLPKKWKWTDIRSDVHPKETYFEPYVASRGLEDTPGRGRQLLGREAKQRYARVRKLCREDVANLEARIRAHLTSA